MAERKPLPAPRLVEGQIGGVHEIVEAFGGALSKQRISILMSHPDAPEAISDTAGGGSQWFLDDAARHVAKVRELPLPSGPLPHVLASASDIVAVFGGAISRGQVGRAMLVEGAPRAVGETEGGGRKWLLDAAVEHIQTVRAPGRPRNEK